MRSRLCRINNWEQLARAARYQVKALAKLAQVSVSQLERFFKHKTGKAPFEWMRDLRQREAFADLITTDKPVKAVAYDHGFKQPGHFAREFAGYFGKPPSEVQWASIMARTGTASGLQRASFNV